MFALVKEQISLISVSLSSASPHKIHVHSLPAWVMTVWSHPTDCSLSLSPNACMYHTKLYTVLYQWIYLHWTQMLLNSLLQHLHLNKTILVIYIIQHVRFTYNCATTSWYIWHNTTTHINLYHTCIKHHTGFTLRGSWGWTTGAATITATTATAGWPSTTTVIGISNSNANWNTKYIQCGGFGEGLGTG